MSLAKGASLTVHRLADRALYARRLTLAGLFVATLVGVTLLVGALFVAFLESSRRSMLRSAQLVRESAAMRIEADVHAELRQGARTLHEIERALQAGVVDASSEPSIETLLLTELLSNDQVADVTLTHAQKRGFGPDGTMETDPHDRWKVSVFRVPSEGGHTTVIRHVARVGDDFLAEVRARPQGLGSVPALVSSTPDTDPTADPSFRAATSASAQGQTIFSDLVYAERDERLPTERRRVVQNVQKAIADGSGEFLGMVSVGLLARAVDSVAQVKVNARDPSDPHRIFLCDRRGRLITRISPDDERFRTDDGLRVSSAHLPPSVDRALKSSLLRALGPANRDRSEVFVLAGVAYLATFHWFSRSEDWIVGIVVPEDYYVHDLRVLRDRFLTAYAAISVVLLGGGVWVLRVLRRGLGQVVEATARMRRLDFSPSEDTTAFVDVQQTIDGLERAKTALRAMEKYVPMNLVRDLYASNREPTLGGKLQELTILFSDIRDFTSLSERLAPDELARALGRYFETITRVVTARGGTVDKFIGDSVMAFWNAPGACPGHEALACRAVLDCLAATRRLYASESWTPLPPLFTRFGVNTDTVLVGHFGAPARFSYTAMGDGVNVAARLESLCKLYRVPALVSESVERRARHACVFRLVDCVAVKGKTKPVRVFELLGAAGEDIPGLVVSRQYESALQRYRRRDFATALALLELLRGDGPSEVLAERCRRYLKEPPSPDWDGSFHPDHK